jgi:hypothetical protein
MKSSGKQAVFIIHGIGNQYPMQTGREFVTNLKKEEDILYSSPDRHANYYETRRLSINNKNTDFFEFYWANLMDEPKNGDLYVWIFKLLFIKKPSIRAKQAVYAIRFLFFVIIFTFLYFFLTDMYESYVHRLNFINTGVFSITIFIFFKFLVPNIESRVVRTVGDAMHYLTASPKSIPSRYKIRKKGLQLLRNLHNKKDDQGQPFYDRIIIVSHSLGSVIAYDLLTNFWYENMYKIQPNLSTFSQNILKEMNDYVINFYQKSETNQLKFDLNHYQDLQRKLFREFKQNGNPWRVSDLITLGSPLCHGGFILAQNEDDFIWRRRFREFPLSPPKIEVKIENGKIEKDLNRGFLFNKKIKINENESQNAQIISHSSVFAIVRWHNIYFKNDLIGGDLSENFGVGIKNIILYPKGHFIKKYFPIHSHTDYWHCKQTESLAIIRQLIGI